MSQIKSPPSASSAGFRKGAHVVITGPPHNNRKGGSAADPHEGATGIITREGSSSNGGWFELKLDHTNELVYYRRGSLRVLGLAYDSDSDESNISNVTQIQRHTTRQRDRERERERRRARAAADRAAKDEHTTNLLLTSNASTASTELEMDDETDVTVDSTVAYSSDEFEQNYYMYTTQHQKHIESDIMELERVSVRKRRRKQTPMRSIQCGSPSFVCTLYNAVSIY